MTPTALAVTPFRPLVLGTAGTQQAMALRPQAQVSEETRTHQLVVAPRLTLAVPRLDSEAALTQEVMERIMVAATELMRGRTPAAVSLTQLAL